MSEQIAERTVEWAFSQAKLARAKGVSFSFFGGEPFLGLPAFQRVVVRACDAASVTNQKVEFRVNTNGSLITDELASFLIAKGVALDLSLDGDKATTDSFRKVRGGGSAYDAVGGVERIAQLHERGLGISINLVVGPDTVRRLSHNIRFLWENGLTAIQILPMFDGGRPWSEEDFAALDENLKRIAGRMIVRVLREGNADVLLLNPFAKVIRLMLAAERTEAAASLRQETYCGIGRRSFSVDVNGNIYACPRLIHEARIDRTGCSLIVGNVMSCEYNAAVFERFKAWNPRTEPRCACSSCEYALTCIYQCLGENLAWQGDEYAVSQSVCRVTKIVHQYALELRNLFYPSKYPA
jgi:uncharacterized protein